jgi:hypothetical protein
MISIDSGHYGGTNLAGVQFLVTFQMGTWSKIYVTDKVTPEQEKAVEALLPLAFAGFHKGMLSFSKVPITMEVTDARCALPSRRWTWKWCGMNGQAIKVLNLPGGRCRTTRSSGACCTSTKRDPTGHPGTNGFVSTMNVGAGHEAVRTAAALILAALCVHLRPAGGQLRERQAFYLAVRPSTRRPRRELLPVAKDAPSRSRRRSTPNAAGVLR